MFKLKNRFVFCVMLLALLACSKSGARQKNSAAKDTKTTGTIEQKTITFKAPDGLDITADLSVTHALSAPFIILFHQAGWSRGEYREIMPKLNEMGFNCMAVDLRSGGDVNGVDNETHKRAVSAGKGTTYLDAYQDMQAALQFAHAHYAEGKLIAWGSSYSSALVLKLTGENGKIIDGVLAFSPGEYFTKLGQSGTFITDAARKIACPVFITSANGEQQNWQSIFDAIPSEKKQSFTPSTRGNHGSRALWAKFSDSKDYWQHVTAFLTTYFLKPQK